MRAILGPEDEDQKDEVLLGSWGSEWGAGVKHRKLLLERFGLVGNAKALSLNCDFGDWASTAGEDQDTDVFTDEAKEFISRRGLKDATCGAERLVDPAGGVGVGKVRVVKVEGRANPADVGTKFLSATELAEMLAVLNI